MKLSQLVVPLTILVGISAISIVVPIGLADLAMPDLPPEVHVIYPEKKDPPKWESSEDSLLTADQLAWRDELAQCESSGDPLAVNPIDRDGTSSYGLYQFKPGTLIGISRAYLTIYIDEKNVMQAIYDPIVQNAALAQMIHHRDEINWHQQFPACVARLGIPPEAPTCTTDCPLVESHIYNDSEAETKI